MGKIGGMVLTDVARVLVSASEARRVRFEDRSMENVLCWSIKDIARRENEDERGPEQRADGVLSHGYQEEV
jgi:hypothetical protein